MIRPPPRSTRTDTLVPYTTLFRSSGDGVMARVVPIGKRRPRLVPLPMLAGPIDPIRRRFGGLAAAASDVPRLPAIPAFVAGGANRCPDCHGEAFHVGRHTAAGAGCGRPMGIVTVNREGGGWGTGGCVRVAGGGRGS